MLSMLRRFPFVALAAIMGLFRAVPLVSRAPFSAYRGPAPRYRRRTGIRNISPAHSSSVRKLQRLERQAAREAAGR
jgi:hypothetical protein